MPSPAVRRLARVVVLALGLSVGGADALADPPLAGPPVCGAPNAGLPADLAAWTGGIDMVAAPAVTCLADARLAPGVAARLTLRPGSEVAFSKPPEKPPTPETSGGLLVLSIPQAGTYRIALSAGVWIDVLKDGQFQTAIAHGHGPACTTIRKMVDFALAPGDYVIQLSGAPEARIEVLAAPLP